MRKLSRRQVLRLAGLAATVPLVSKTAFAQTYPTRPVKLVVAFTAGGTTDLLARILSPALSERLGQQVVIENKPGGGTHIAIQSVVELPPDGHTLPMNFSHHTNKPSLFQSLPVP